MAIRVTYEEFRRIAFPHAVLVTAICPQDLDPLFEWLKTLEKEAEVENGHMVDACHRVYSDPKGQIFAFEDLETAVFFRLRFAA